MDYGLSKSFVGGKYIKATSLSGAGRKALREGKQMHRAKKGSVNDALAFRETMRDVKSMTADPSKVPYTGMAGFTVRTGSKSSGQGHAFVKPGANPVTHVHEGAHADPKRSAYRLHGQIKADPEKGMREEARADYLAQGHFEGLRNPDKKKLFSRKQPEQRRTDVTSLYQRAAIDERRIQQGKRASSMDHTFTRQAIGAYSDPSATDMMRQIDSGKRGINAYSEVHDKMRAAGTKQRVVKSMESQMVRNARGKFAGRSIVGFGMTQMDIPLDTEDEVEKADNRPYRDESKGELPYRRSDARQGQISGGLLAPLAGGTGIAYARAGKRLGSKALKVHGGGLIALGAGGAAASGAFTRDLKRGGTAQHRFTPEVKKAYSNKQFKRDTAVANGAAGLGGAGIGFGALGYKQGHVSGRTGAALAVGGGALAAGGIKHGFRADKKAKQAGLNPVLGSNGGLIGQARDRRRAASLSKGMPDMADVHIQGVLKPLKRVGKVHKALAMPKLPSIGGVASKAGAMKAKVPSVRPLGQAAGMVKPGNSMALTGKGKAVAGGAGAVGAGFGANQFMQQRKQRMGIG